MIVRTLGTHDAKAYRALMLEAYGAYPQAFTSSVAERAAMPLSWWEKRLSSPLDRLLGAKRALGLGMGLLLLGYAALSQSPAAALWLPVPLLLLGHALFKPSIQAALVFLYERNDPRLDGAEVRNDEPLTCSRHKGGTDQLRERIRNIFIQKFQCIKIAATHKTAGLFQIGKMILRQVVHLNEPSSPASGSIGAIELEHPARPAIRAYGGFHRLILPHR